MDADPWSPPQSQDLATVRYQGSLWENSRVKTLEVSCKTFTGLLPINLCTAFASTHVLETVRIWSCFRPTLQSARAKSAVTARQWSRCKFFMRWQDWTETMNQKQLMIITSGWLVIISYSYSTTHWFTKIFADYYLKKFNTYSISKINRSSSKCSPVSDNNLIPVLLIL